VDDPEHHHHEGFYLRVSLPIGWQRTRFKFDDSTSRADFTVSGAARGLELRLGGTPAEGVAMGVQLYGTSAGEKDVSFPGEGEAGAEDGPGNRSDVTVSSSLVGFFVDYFPDPRQNLHLGGSLGLASNVIEHDLPNDSDLDNAGGLGAAAWVGYGWWLSKNWSFGGLGQVTGSFGETNGGAMTARSLSVVGMLSLLYH
jgi:hypothetical protein